MSILLTSFIVFSVGYFINMLYVTVFYHRGLAHKSIILKPGVQKFIAATGPWVTGIDPKGWVCMHRLHHMHSDGPGDPHSPVQFGVFGVAMAQLKSYERVLRGLLKNRQEYTKLVKDLEFGVHYLNGRRRWLIPYFLHFGIGIGLGFLLGNLLVTAAYFLGIMSHPVQGWMVNSLAHHYGYRNFDTKDNSKNNSWVAYLVTGEGFQNNHHTFPHRANFAVKPWEFDIGYAMCFIPVMLGMASFQPKATANTMAEYAY